MKKALIIVLAIAFGLGTVPMSSMAANTARTDSRTLAISEPVVETVGISISAENFADQFSGEPSKRRAASTKSRSYTALALSSIVINGADISFIATLSADAGEEHLPLKGRLSAGFKSQQGINSIIVNVTDNNAAYNVLLFEIFNAYEKDNLLIEPTLFAKPHVKFYMQDKAGQLYLFETELPEIFSKLEASQYKPSDSRNDALWAAGLAKYEITELPVDDEILGKLGLDDQAKMKLSASAALPYSGSTLARGLSTETRWQPTVNSTSYYIGTILHRFYSLPYIDYLHTNVRSSDSTWYARLRIAESLEYNGFVFYGQNFFAYKDIDFKFACGEKTNIIRTYHDGRAYAAMPSGTVFTLFENAVSTVPAGAAIATILNLFNSMRTWNPSYALSSTYSCTSGSVAEGAKLLGSRYILHENSYGGSSGHWFEYQVVTKFVIPSGGTNAAVNTVGAFKFEFDAIEYYTGLPVKHYSDYATLSYNAAP